MKPTLTHIRHRAIRSWLTLVMILLSATLFGQTNPTDSIPDDPAAIKVYNTQSMSFGTFSNSGAGGTVAISTSGSRAVTGTITPLNMGNFFYQAIFEISAPQGTIITILFGPDATLTGSNGGTMKMKQTGSSPASPFVANALQPARTPVSISGTLTVGNSAANPPGAYSGTFYVTFNNQ